MLTLLERPTRYLFFTDGRRPGPRGTDPFYGKGRVNAASAAGVN
jgi:hypothetical protein